MSMDLGAIDYGLVVLLVTKGGFLAALYFMWRQARRAAEDARHVEREQRAPARPAATDAP